MKAVKEYALGSKAKFFDLTMHDGFSKQFEQDFQGNPMNVEITEEQLSAEHLVDYSVITRLNSPYLIRNNLVEKLSQRSFSTIMQQVEEKKLRLGQVAAATYALEKDMQEKEVEYKNGGELDEK